MTKDFISRLLTERCIDTKQYRYIATEEHDSEKQWLEIKRLPIDQLNTTASIDSWVTIKRIY